MTTTTEFSFILKPSDHGVGVFSTEDIKEGTYLSLFGNQTNPLQEKTRLLDKNDVPEEFQSYCIDRGDKLICPPDFSAMPVGWFMNHSKNPNAKRNHDYKWFASRDIKSGEEITADYNTLEEPEESKEDYYK